MLKRIKSINKFYDISSDIKVSLYSDFFRYFRDYRIWKAFYRRLSRLTGARIEFFWDPEKKIAIDIKKQGFDLVYARAQKVVYYLARDNVPVIWETHNAKKPDEFRKKVLSEAIGSVSFLGISTISEKIKETLVDSGVAANKVLVQEDAVELEKFDAVNKSKNELRQELDLPTDKQIVTYSGTLRPGKNIEGILKTAKLMENNPEIVFLIAGGPEERRRYFEGILQEENINNVHFLGFIENKNIPKLLKASDVLIMLYDPYAENTVMDINTTSPIKLFEYMASRVPIVTTRIPTLEKVVRDREEVLFVPPNDYKATSKAINSILKDSRLREELSRNAYNRAKEHTYKKRCNNILNYFYKQ